MQFFFQAIFFLPFHLNAGFIALCLVTSSVTAYLMAVKWIKMLDELRPLTIEDHQGKNRLKGNSGEKSSWAAKWKRFSADFFLCLKYKWYRKQAFSTTKTCDNPVGGAKNLAPQSNQRAPYKHTTHRLILNGIYCEIPGEKLFYFCVYRRLVHILAADVVQRSKGVTQMNDWGKTLKRL